MVNTAQENMTNEMIQAIVNKVDDIVEQRLDQQIDLKLLKISNDFRKQFLNLKQTLNEKLNKFNNSQLQNQIK